MATNRENYELYRKKVEEAHVTEEMDRLKMANISVIQPAMVPPKPIKPRIALNILLGILLGSLAGLGFAFIAEYFGGGYTRPEQAARDLGLPVLASLRHKA